MAELVKKIESEEQKIQSEIKAYCLKCKKQVSVEKPEILQTSNKRSRISGGCPECNKKVSQFLKSEKKEESPAPTPQ